ncbi:hypothetical protein E9840_04925 [Tissierella creatinini]|nr:hypothetical protein E9840_04925 [Tissierella creatinini]TJX67184.1 hypothetical protein E8P77_06155 [Soehngenia saccharolytica]
MESRLDRYKKRRKEYFIRLLKSIVISILGSILLLSLYRVNETIVGLNVLDNAKMLELDLRHGVLTILGETFVFNIGNSTK